MGKPNIDRIIAIHGHLPEGSGKMSYSQLEAAYNQATRKIEDLEHELQLVKELLPDDRIQVEPGEPSNVRPEVQNAVDDGGFNDDELRI